MALEISYCNYRLLFKRPFGTAHGLRDGTDSLFVRIEEEGIAGFGEITLPPYLSETIPGAMERLRSIAARRFDHAGRLLAQVDQLDELKVQDAGTRAGLTTALIDLISKHRQWPVRKLLELDGVNRPIALATIGICPTNEISARLAELPRSGAIKVKVGDPDAGARLDAILALDDRPLFLDGNEGIGTLEEALNLVTQVGRERMLGLEQPFATAMDDRSRALADDRGVVVFADESIQSKEDLVARSVSYDGVNIKLMKCGGMDKASEMMTAVRRLGMRVMLGSMSESSLGSTAMAQLAGGADIVDLDGPWLIRNDPFEGQLVLHGGCIDAPGGLGVGASLKADLDFTPFSA